MQKKTSMIEVPLELSEGSLNEINERRVSTIQALNKVAFAREKDNDLENDRLAFRRPPNMDSHIQLSQINQDLDHAYESYREKAKAPKSKILISKNAWAWSLRKQAAKLDDLASAILKNNELYLCRYILQLVDMDKEKIQTAQMNLSIKDDAQIYSLWPTESYKTKNTINANAQAKIALTSGLEIIQFPVSGSVEVAWKGNWSWVSALIKAWGKGEKEAGWILNRDNDAPFSGEREMYLILQLPKKKKPKIASAKIQAEIDFGFFFKAHYSAAINSIDIGYTVS
jgi:hypothetical protein